MSRLLLLVVCFILAIPRGAGAQGVFEITPETLYTDTNGQGEVVLQNATSDAVVLDSMTMRWNNPDVAVHVWYVTAVGQPTSGNEESYEFFNVYNTETVDLTFSEEDTLSLTFSLDSCGICLEAEGRTFQVDTLVFHSNGDIATDTLIVDWANLVADEEGPVDNSNLDLTVQPNPSNGSVHVELSLDRPEDVSVAVYDVRGRQISVLNRGSMPPGEYTFTWDGSGVAPGIYVFRASTEEASMARSVTITR